MRLHLPLIFACLFAVAGCLSDQDYIRRRIDSNPERFERYPQDVQARLARGELHIGDDQTAAWFVYGEPTRKSTRITAAGKTEIWSYTIETIRSNIPEPRLISYPVRTATGRTVFVHDYYYMDDLARAEVEVLRIEFQNARVALIEAADHS